MNFDYKFFLIKQAFTKLLGGKKTLGLDKLSPKSVLVDFHGPNGSVTKDIMSLLGKSPLDVTEEELKAHALKRSPLDV